MASGCVRAQFMSYHNVFFFLLVVHRKYSDVPSASLQFHTLNSIYMGIILFSSLKGGL